MDLNLAAWALSPVDFDQDEPLLIDALNPQRSLSFSQLREQVRRLVAGLRAIGVRSGDCVCVNAFNDIYWTVLYLGIMGAGAIFTGVNPGYSVHELTHHFGMVEPRVMIVEPALLERSLTAAKEYRSLPESQIYAFDVLEPLLHPIVRSWTTLLQHGEGEFAPCPDSGSAIAAYQTTSGTSGLPKAAMIPHAYLIHQSKQRMNRDSVNYRVRRLTALPPMHAFATPIVPASIRQGAPTYIMRRYDQTEFIQAIEKYHITETYLAPPLLLAIPRSPLANKKALQSLRQIWFGGAAIAYENRLLFYNLLRPDAIINPVWGMTETGWNTTINWPERRTDSSVGVPLQGYQVRVVDDDGCVLRQKHAIGELQVLCPHPMMGYHRNKEATNEAFSIGEEGRWVNTGDIGYTEPDGNVFIVDRKKDLIKVRGWQVSPAEVEGRLLQHPELVDVGVIGIPLPRGEGEICRAYVVRKGDSRLTTDGLFKFAAVELARYKCPEEIIFVEQIPRNPTGKILRRVLREQATGHMETKPRNRFALRAFCLASVSLGVVVSMYCTIPGRSRTCFLSLSSLQSIQHHVMSFSRGG